MGRNRVYDDIDHVSVDNKATKKSKNPPPDPWPLPQFEPLEINNPFRDGQGKLPSNIPNELGRKAHYCKAWECASRTKTNGRVKKPLQELSSNSTRGQRRRARLNPTKRSGRWLL